MALIFSRIKGYLALAGAFLLMLATVWFKGKQSADQRHEKEKLEGYVETRERMDEISKPVDANSAREWLRKRGE